MSTLLKNNSKNAIKYFIVNNDNIVAVIYEHEEYGRTMVIEKTVDINCAVEIFEKNGDKMIDMDFLEYIASMLPVYKPK